MTRPPDAPRFLGVVLSLLAPVLLVAAVAGGLLVREYRAGQREARLRVAEAAGGVADQMGAWIDANTRADSNRVVVLGPDFRLTSPAAPDWPPEPAPLFAPVEPSAAAAWREFQRISSTRGDSGTDAINAALEQVLTRLPGREFTRHRVVAAFEVARAIDEEGRSEAAIEAYIRVLRMSERSVAGETGAPLDGLAALRLLELSNGDPAGLLRAWDGDEWRAQAWVRAAVGGPILKRIIDRLRRRPDLTAARGLIRAAEQGAILQAVAESLIKHLRAQGRAGEVVILRDWVLWPMLVPDALADGSEQERVAYLATERCELEALLTAARTRADPRGQFGCALPVLGTDAVQGEGLEVTRRTSAGVDLRVKAWLREPTAYFARERQRFGVFLVLLVGMVGCGLFAAVSARRALVRQWQLGQAKSNFLAAVSHELRTPLGSIRLLAEGLERGTVQEATRQAEYHRLIREESQRLGSLVENVLEVSRIERGRRFVERESIDLRRVVESTVAAFAPLARQAGVELNWEDDAAATEVDADGRALQQALGNLLDNALKHSSGGGQIRVRIDRRTGEVGIMVSDQGPGIPQGDQERIFEPFYRRGSELRRETRGVGLGLSIVRSLMEAHGGRVELRSLPGQGATFTLVLPCEIRSDRSSDRWPP